MRKNRDRWAISFVFILALCTSLYAQRGQWVYLGDAHVDGAQDHDSIKVGRSVAPIVPSSYESVVAGLILNA